MLTQLQINKLARFFYILDYDRNGVIEKEDFIGIAENLCILWRIREGEEKYDQVKSRFVDGGDHFNSFVNNDEGKAKWDHLRRFAEATIVRGD